MSRLNDFIDIPTRKLNRLSSRAPRSGIFWCGGCDANHVGAGEKCSVCGWKDKNCAKKKDLT